MGELCYGRGVIALCDVWRNGERSAAGGGEMGQMGVLAVKHLFAACVARGEQARSDKVCVGVIRASLEMQCDRHGFAREHPLFGIEFEQFMHHSHLAIATRSKGFQSHVFSTALLASIITQRQSKEVKSGH